MEQRGRLGLAGELLAFLALGVGVEDEALGAAAVEQDHAGIGMPSASTVERAMPFGSFGSEALASSSQLSNRAKGS
jgi:hypothetical protein